MRHHQQVRDFSFVEAPVEFNKYTDLALLRYCLGATMYMPGTRDFAKEILHKKYPGLTSMVMCFEDACREVDIPAAEDNVLKLLDTLSQYLENGVIRYADIPLIVFRVRSPEQFRTFCARIKKEHLRLITGFNFPKFNTQNGLQYFSYLKELNSRYPSENVYGMPILESREMAFIETRMAELLEVKRILDAHRSLVLNIRVGGTDFSACFGVRRTTTHTIYDIITVSDCLKDILNVFARDNNYSVSGPVWEYFRVSRESKFKSLSSSVHDSLFRREPLVNEEVDGLLQEILLDQANGFIGKTVIHPTHIPYVNGMLAVTREEHEDALQVLQREDGVVKSKNGNKMNEVNPHRIWAEKLYMRAQAYGVIENNRQHARLFLTDGDAGG
ncbi:MAG: HpcH/HpaI aldolase/citrate lyase family protein [Coriobacteriia bacterium]|nr:HpcH/HpaI aldolase/citrate lyase family protein [Coriobacteriia bacterium]